MLKCEMCLGRTLRGELSVLRSVDRSIEYEAGTAIEITENTHKINVKIDGITVKINANGCLTVDIPDIYAVTAILETLSRYPLDHNYRDLRPLVPNGVNQGKWATETVGANNKPIYMNQGVITASNANIGANNNPIFMNQGVVTASDATVGAANKPIHMENGIIKASGANVGSTSKPLFMNSGVLTQCGNSLDVSVTGNANNATNDALAQKIDETYLKGITIGADGTITLTRGDGQSTTYTTLKDFMDDVNQDIADIITDVSQNYVKRTPDDISSNPWITYNGAIVYNKITNNSRYSSRTSYFYKNGSSYERVNFVAYPCKNESYDSNKTYYKFNYQTNDYEYYNASATTWLANRDDCYYIYDNQHSMTFEEELNEPDSVNSNVTGKLYEQTVNSGGGSWNSNTDFPNGIPHSGVMTVTGRFDTLISITDLTVNKVLGWVAAKDIYGTGAENMSVMVIKGHRYSVDGYEQITIGFFGD